MEEETLKNVVPHSVATAYHRKRKPEWEFNLNKKKLSNLLTFYYQQSFHIMSILFSSAHIIIKNVTDTNVKNTNLHLIRLLFWQLCF